jgi:hypothetical protein
MDWDLLIKIRNLVDFLIWSLSLWGTITTTGALFWVSVVMLTLVSLNWAASLTARFLLWGWSSPWESSSA